MRTIGARDTRNHRELSKFGARDELGFRDLKLGLLAENSMGRAWKGLGKKRVPSLQKERSAGDQKARLSGLGLGVSSDPQAQSHDLVGPKRRIWSGGTARLCCL